MLKNVNVIISLNKPAGITSQQAVTRVKRLLGVRKAGHTGTLDPMATGLLLVCLNEATKISGFLLDMDKRYRARVKLGERTDTYDAEGRITEKKDISSLTGVEIAETVSMFRGRITQKPPMYSAVKIGGERLYKLARKGIEVERPDRTVNIYEIKIEGIDLPYLDLTVSCSKGTYIRTLCDDIGLRLGTGAHLFSLERSGIGPFHIKDAVSLDDLPGVEPNCFYSIDSALSALKDVILNDMDYGKAKHGMRIENSKRYKLINNEFVKLKSPSGKLFGIGIADHSEHDVIKIKRLLNL